MNYRMEEKPNLTLLGHRMLCMGCPEDTENIHEETKKHWFSSREMQRKMKEVRVGAPIWYDIYTDFKEEEFAHIIAVEANEENIPEGLETIEIPSNKYAIFETKRCESPDEEWKPLMRRIVSEWMPTTDYVMAEYPQINKQYFEKDFSKRYIEIWIPIEKR